MYYFKQNFISAALKNFIFGLLPGPPCPGSITTTKETGEATSVLPTVSASPLYHISIAASKMIPAAVPHFFFKLTLLRIVIPYINMC